MKEIKCIKYIKQALLISLLFLPCACSPKEIGYTYADEPMSGGQSTAELMRYPVTGASNTQKMLYLNNRPAVMEQMTNWTRAQHHRQGEQIDEPGAQYNPAVRQRGLFRQ